MNKNLQETITKFISEAKMIAGAEGAIFELSELNDNCLILTGEIYGRDTNDKISELGRKNGIVVLANNLSILYDKPKGKKTS